MKYVTEYENEQLRPTYLQTITNIFTRLTASFPHGQMHFLRLRIHNANVKRDRGNHENMKKKTFNAIN